MESTVIREFGLRIKSLRLGNNWTQEQLAVFTGFHPTYIGRVERGERNISLKNIEVFCRIFKMSLSDLLKFQ